MDNTLLLSHFCEKDGPSVLFCTHRTTNTQQYLYTSAAHNIAHNITSSSSIVAVDDDDDVKHDLKHGRRRIDENLNCYKKYGYESAKTIAAAQKTQDGSNSGIVAVVDGGDTPPLLSQIEYMTIDDDSSDDEKQSVAAYFSSHTVHSEYSSRLKSMCLRSLSVEYVGPGREGLVLFGSRDQGYQLAYVFRIKDAKARGFTRWFAFLLIHSNLGMLTLSWSFVQKCVHYCCGNDIYRCCMC